MPPPTTAAENEIVNRAFQSVTGLTPESATGKAPVGYAGEARGTAELSDLYKFGAARPYTPPAAPAAAPAPATPAPMPVQNVPVNPVVNIPPPAPPATSIGATPASGPASAIGGIANPIPPKPVYPVGRNVPWQQTTQYWKDMDEYRKAGGI